MNKIKMQDVSIVFPVKLESVDRKVNLYTVFNYLQKIVDAKFIICEESTVQVPQVLSEFSGQFEYIHTKIRADEHFHKAKIINLLVKTAKTPFVMVNDSDVVITYEQYKTAAEVITRNNNIVILPYDQLLRRIPKNKRNLISQLHTMKDFDCLGSTTHVHPPEGGCVLFKKDVFESVGGMNEFFINYGPEDAELIYRFVCLGYPLVRINGPIFHLEHDRLQYNENNPFFCANDIEYARIRSMSVERLRHEISIWKKTR